MSLVLTVGVAPEEIAVDITSVLMNDHGQLEFTANNEWICDSAGASPRANTKLAKRKVT